MSSQNPSRRSAQRQGKPQSADDMESVILDLARVTRVQQGGKRLRFRACIGVGNQKGKVGIGIAKGADVAIAVEKATRRAKKLVIDVPITENGAIPHAIRLKFKAAKILLKPTAVGSGIKAGGVIRILCELAGIKNISAKMLGSNNKVTNAQAVILAFGKFKV
jgi:small subunit ribosomal protein S5